MICVRSLDLLASGLLSKVATCRAGGVGHYSLRANAGNRDQGTRRYAQLVDRHRNPLSDEFQQEKKTLEGLERYLVQLWRESLATNNPRPADPGWPDRSPGGGYG